MFDSLKKKITSFFKKEEEKLEEKIPPAPKTDLIPTTEEELKQQLAVEFQEEKAEEIIEETPVEEPAEKAAEEIPEETPEEEKEVTPKAFEKQMVAAEEPKTEKRFLPKLTFGTRLKKAITRKAEIKKEDVETLLWDFQLELLESDVSVGVAEKITKAIEAKLVGREISTKESVAETTKQAIKQAIEEILIEPDYDFIKKVRSKKPFVMLFLGPNGHGKSTTIGKMAVYLKKNDLTSVMVAADTFRAAAIEQLEKIGEKAGVRVIKHQYGADPAAVAFDGIKHAQTKNIDVVLVDTAGRSELNTNLMEQMKKIVRVANPDMKIYVGEALAGNAAVEEAKKFNEFISIDGVIMTKTDCDVKGGGVLSISHEIQKPILFLGMGQSLDTLQPFKKQWFISKIFEE